MTRRGWIIHRLLLASLPVAVLTSVAGTVMASLADRNDIAGVVMVACLTWIYAVWYREGARRKVDRERAAADLAWKQAAAELAWEWAAVVLDRKAASPPALDVLEADLLAAKRSYAENPTEETKAAKQAAAEALREARAVSRSAGHRADAVASRQGSGDLGASVDFARLLRERLRDNSPVSARRVRCLHGNAVPVESAVDGEVVARLCLDCDEQLPLGIVRGRR